MFTDFIFAVISAFGYLNFGLFVHLDPAVDGAPDEPRETNPS